MSPEKIIKYSISQSKKKNIEVLWASTRETYNIFEAERMKAHIITVPHNILSKFNMLGMSLKKLSLSTVQSFLKDSIKAGFKIRFNLMKKKIFITGGAGYVGARLVNDFLKKGYELTVYDIMYFGDYFLPKDNPNLKIIKGDIRDQRKLKDSSKNHDYFVHLACISNDTSFALDEKLSTSVNLDAFQTNG